MMPDFADADVGTLGRAWWRRCQPQIGPALAVGALVGLLIGGGLTARQLPLDTLTLWSKYRLARGADGIGLSSLKIMWPDERGEAETTVGELLQTPGLHAWAQPVSNEIGRAVAPALLGGFLAFVATLLWSASWARPDRAVDDSLEPTTTALEPTAVEAETPLPHVPPLDEHSLPVLHDTPIEAVIKPPPVAVEEPFPVIHSVPPPMTLPHLTNQDESQSPNNPPQAPPRDTPTPVSQPHPATSATPPGKSTFSYEAYWGLAELPFENVPDPKFYFPAPMHEEALHRLLYGIQTRKGAVMLTGEIGCGKTLLSRELSLHLSGQQYDVAVIANPSLSTEEFLTEVLYQLGIEPTVTKVKLLHLLNERLMDNYKRGRQTVVVIDEVQTIPNDQIFEELRLLLYFQLNDRFLLTLVLMGQPELNDRVSVIKQFAQRISIRYHLGCFSSEQTTQYIQFRLKAGNCTKPIFTAEALDAISKQSGGGPPKHQHRLRPLPADRLHGSRDRRRPQDRRAGCR